MPNVNGTENRLLTDDIILKNALRLLKNECVLVKKIHRDLEQRFGKQGDTISLELPFRTKTASGRTLVVQPMVDESIPFNIDRQEHFGLRATVRDRTLSIEQYTERYLKSGIVQLAQKIETSVATALKSAFFSSGTPGVAINTKTFHLAKAHMTDVGVPNDGMRCGAVNPLDCAEISDAIANKFNENMVKTSLQKGYVGPLAEIELYESASLVKHTVGAHGGTPLINGAAQTGSSLVTDGWNASVTGLFKQGDVFTIAGVYEINPQTYQTTGRLQRFVVTADVDSDGSGNATIPVSPSINDGSLTTVDGDGSTVSLAAFQNVTSAPADNAAITVEGTAGATYNQNYVFHKDAAALAMIDLELPRSATVKERVRDPESGLSLSMVEAFDIVEHRSITRIDAVWGTDMIYPELAHRIWSTEAA